MTKTSTAALAAHLRQEVTTVANIYDLVWEDGTEFFFTDLDEDIKQFESNDYIAFPGFDASAVASSSGLNVDNLDLTTFIEAAAMDVDDIRAGRWSNAEIKQRLLNYNDHSMGSIILRFGSIGQITNQDDLIKAEVRGLLHYLQNGMGAVVSLKCRARLFSTELPDACNVTRVPPLWVANSFAFNIVRPAMEAGRGHEVSPLSFNDRAFRLSAVANGNQTGASEPSWNLTVGGSTVDNDLTWETMRARLVTDLEVASVTDRGQFVVTTITDAPDLYLTLGKVECLTGLNAGLKRVAKSWTLSSKEIITTRDFPFDIVATDTFSISAGCNKTPEVCDVQFDNWNNFRGENLTPKEDQVLEFQEAVPTA